jgi:hypothetical protein
MKLRSSQCRRDNGDTTFKRGERYKTLLVDLSEDGLRVP